MKKIVGSSKATNGTISLQAVKVIPISKNIFCVGNLQPDCTDEILKAFVTQMGVRFFVRFIRINPNLTTIVTVSGYVSMPMICQFFVIQ